MLRNLFAFNIDQYLLSRDKEDLTIVVNTNNIPSEQKGMTF